MYLMRYIISHVFGSCPSPPTAPPPTLHSPLPHPLVILLPPLYPLGQSLLILPSTRNPCPWPPHRLLAGVYNRPHCDVLHDRILHLQDISSHIIKPRLLHCCIQWWVLSDPIIPSIWLPPRNPPSDPVLEVSQGPPHGGVSTHVYDPNKRTAYTTALKKTPDTRRLEPSLPRILASRAQIFHDLRSFPTTVVQTSSADVKTRPRYFNEVTI